MAQDHEIPNPSETVISADVRDRTEARAISSRIFWLTREKFKHVATTDGGWSKLFIDDAAQYWELSYPKSNQHGGGPPELQRVETNLAKARYALE